jgi:hypothetical protein
MHKLKENKCAIYGKEKPRRCRMVKESGTLKLKKFKRVCCVLNKTYQREI